MIQDLSGSRYIKGTDESTLATDSSVPLIHNDPYRFWITDPDPDHPKGTHPNLCSFAKVECLHLSSSKLRCGRFLGRLVGSFFAFCFVVLTEFKNLLFQLVFCHAVVIGSGILQFSQGQVFVFLLAASFCLFLILHTS